MLTVYVAFYSNQSIQINPLRGPSSIIRHVPRLEVTRGVDFLRRRGGEFRRLSRAALVAIDAKPLFNGRQ